MLTALPLFAQAKNPRDREELLAFRSENPCPSDGTIKGTCPGWRVGYIVELCANGQDKRENMRWMTEADRLFVKNANGKNCKKLRRATLYP
ncbi:HNH endonuclease [Variovorax sp. RHLX14]|uniref:HNH endonuclease n=1 Tax=Variovorax sp. RHLX14 TaxID=1259731 RepID=UPI003F49927D